MGLDWYIAPVPMKNSLTGGINSSGTPVYSRTRIHIIKGKP